MTPLHSPLQPCRPLTHPAYAAAIDGRAWLPPKTRDVMRELILARNSADESKIDAIDAGLTEALYWYAIRPDEIARDVLRLHGWRSPLTIEQATVVLAAIAEAGYPITGNGAPDYGHGTIIPPIAGPERDRILWAAADYWARAASRHITYISLGDCRGELCRSTQYDQPGSMAPTQRASLTLGPERDRGDECGSHAYMRRHTRRLILVRAKKES